MAYYAQTLSPPFPPNRVIGGLSAAKGRWIMAATITRDEVQHNITACLARLRVARDSGELAAIEVFEAAFDRLIEEWARTKS